MLSKKRTLILGGNGGLGATVRDDRLFILLAIKSFCDLSLNVSVPRIGLRLTSLPNRCLSFYANFTQLRKFGVEDLGG